MMRMRLLTPPALLLFFALMLMPVGSRAQLAACCDRNEDERITVGDALIALQAAISPCLKDSYCDVDGDFDESVTDALVLLQVAVGLPVALACGQIYIDECFDDGDCAPPGYPPGLFCLPYRCVECEFDTDCADGFVCDGGCTYSCVPPPD